MIMATHIVILNNLWLWQLQKLYEASNLIWMVTWNIFEKNMPMHTHDGGLNDTYQIIK